MFEIINILIATLGFSGFLLANYIRDTKKSRAPLVCPLDGSCDTVIHSEYSKFFNIPVELLGILYYGFITLLYFLLAFFPENVPGIAAYLVLGITFSAFLFSIYLTTIQSFLLKHFCTWCLVSAGICTVIFIFVFFISDTKILELF